MLPVSMFLSRHDVMSVFTPGNHGSTFGGNPLAAAVGLKALEVLVTENLTSRAAELGDYLQSKLNRNLCFDYIHWFVECIHLQ